MRCALLVCVMLAAPLRADPPVAEAAPPRGPCVATKMILVRSAQPHVDALKAQVLEFLATTSGSPATTDGGLAEFKLQPPRAGVESLTFIPDALGGIIMARSACGDHFAGNDAEVLEYVTALHTQLRDMRLIVTDIKLIDLLEGLEKMTAGDKVEVTKP